MSLPGKGRPPDPEPSLAGQQDAVADTVGSILMVAITVAMSVMLAFILLAYKGPSPLVHADLAVSVAPGRDGAWGTGDEALRVVHRGGDPLDARAMSVQVRVGPTARSLTGDQLGSAWGDGFLRIGEAWSYVWPIPGGIAQGVPVQAAVVHAGAASQLLAATS
ncbi:MAG TPA: type IV pilin N-terminal domain-containing protein, partial [Candidatus Thermoplasmatota archaeon]|nr:type IV pilin N-terminal domain-containing protein [Candidatus Thermoplasmatota archaeon]